MPFDDTVAEVPQAQTEGIARRLLGDDLVNRYGDVMGARKTTAADVLRDFTIGFRHGQEKVDEIHMKMQDTARKAYNKQAERALAAKQLDMKTAGEAWEAVKWAAEKAPRGYAAGMLKERLKVLGIEPSPTALKMLTDADWVAQLPRAEIDKAVHEDGTIDTPMLNAYFTDPMKLDQFRNQAVRRQRDEADTNRMILGAERTRITQKRDKIKLADESAAHRAGLPQRKAELGVANAEATLGLRQQKLAKGNGGILEKLLSGEGLGQEPTPLDPTAGEQPVAGVEAPTPIAAPSPVDPAKVAAIKAKYGMK